MSQKRTSRISGFLVGAILSFVSSNRLVVLPIDMIRRPSGVTAITFTSGSLTDPVPGRPWAYGIVFKSRPSVMRQMKSVVSRDDPPTMRHPSGVNARHAKPTGRTKAGSPGLGASSSPSCVGRLSTTSSGRATRRTRMPSLPALAIMPPSGENLTSATGPSWTF